MPADTRERILIVDDEADLRSTYRLILERAGFAVDEAASGAEALARAATGPDLVLLDVNLPDMDGYDVCRRLKSDPVTATIPVLHVSGMFRTSEDRTRGLEAGSDGYLSRPVERRELIATVNALLRPRRVEADLRRSEARRAAAEALVEVGSLVAQSTDLATVAARVADRVRGLLRASVAMVFRVEPSTGAMTPLAWTGDAPPERPPPPTYAAGMGSAGVAVRERRVFTTPNVLEDPRVTLEPAVRDWIEHGPYRAALVVPLIFQGEVIGALLAGDRAGRVFTEEEIALAQGFADQATLAVAHFTLLGRLEEAAVGEERVRIARDLHDGVLQTLAGAILQLEVLRRELPEESEVRQRLLEIQLPIVSQQRELRALVQPLKAPPWRPPVGVGDLRARLTDLVAGIERQWGRRVELRSERWRVPVPEALARDVYHLVSEALANAARHARATGIVAEVRTDDDGTATISVTDDGRGFPFRGRYDLKALVAMRAGPVTLMHRVTALRGQLTIDSTPSGSRVEIRLPIAG
jgi:signal transduction histidine kinase